MKQGIHPQYHNDAVMRCSSCGATYEIGSTQQQITITICAKCHPFYTGEQQVVVDKANKISSFKDRMSKAEELKKRKEEIEKQRTERAKSRVGVISSNQEQRLTLRDLMNARKAAGEKK